MELFKNNTDETSQAYVGDYLGRDVAAFCNAYWYDGINPDDKDLKIVRKLWAMENGYSAFCWPGALLPIDWMVYRGMVGRAIVWNIISVVYCIVTLFLSALIALLLKIPTDFLWLISVFFILFYILYSIFMGKYTIRTYYKHVKEKLNHRGLKGRSNVDCFELKESLKKEGKPSILRVILYRLIAELIGAVLSGIIITIIYL